MAKGTGVVGIATVGDAPAMHTSSPNRFFAKDRGGCTVPHLPGEKMERRVRIERGPRAIASAGRLGGEQLEAVWASPSSRILDELDFIVHLDRLRRKDWLRDCSCPPREVHPGVRHRRLHLRRHGEPPNRSWRGRVDDDHHYAPRRRPGYNVMGVAKSALESTTMLSRQRPGLEEHPPQRHLRRPFRTMSAMAVGGSDRSWTSSPNAPMRERRGREVGDAAVFLLSDLTTGVTAQVLYVDCGFSSIVM